MSDSDEPSNVFQFPGVKRAEGEARAEPLKVGAFVDQYGPHLFGPVSQLTDDEAAEWLHEFKRHRAFATMIIDLIEADIERRRGNQS